MCRVPILRSGETDRDRPSAMFDVAILCFRMFTLLMGNMCNHRASCSGQSARRRRRFYGPSADEVRNASSDVIGRQYLPAVRQRSYVIRCGVKDGLPRCGSVRQYPKSIMRVCLAARVRRPTLREWKKTGMSGDPVSCLVVEECPVGRRPQTALDTDRGRVPRVGVRPRIFDGRTS